MKTYRKLKKWHRKLGLCSAAFVILLTITGLALNHTEELQLDQKFVGSTILMDRYNLSLPQDPSSYVTEQHQITLLGDRLYFDAEEIEEHTENLLGAVDVEETVVVAVTGAILLFEQDGEFIEKLTGSEGVPAGMQRIGLSVNKTLIVHAAHGEYRADLDTLEWTEYSSSSIEVQWALATKLDEPLRTQLLHAYRGKGLTLERVMLDLHSGRLLGKWGVYLVDAAAILFLILAISGVWMWSKDGRR